MRTIHQWLRYVEESKRQIRESRESGKRKRSTPKPPQQTVRDKTRKAISRPSETGRQAPPPVRVPHDSARLPPSVKLLREAKPSPQEKPETGETPEKPPQTQEVREWVENIPARLPLSPEVRETLINYLLDPELSLRQVAEILNVCPTTVRRYANKGLLPHHRSPGNQRRFKLSDVVNFIQTRRKTLQKPANP